MTSSMNVGKALQSRIEAKLLERKALLAEQGTVWIGKYFQRMI